MWRHSWKVHLSSRYGAKSRSKLRADMYLVVKSQSPPQLRSYSLEKLCLFLYEFFLRECEGADSLFVEVIDLRTHAANNSIRALRNRSTIRLCHFSFLGKLSTLFHFTHSASLDLKNKYNLKTLYLDLCIKFILTFTAQIIRIWDSK